MADVQTTSPAPATSPAEGAPKAASALDAVMADADPVAVAKKVKVKRTVPEAIATIQSSYNNTIITLSDPQGKALAWSSSGACGFTGTRKSTSYAASQAAQAVSEKSKAYNVERVHVRVSGIGSGREQAIRSLQVGGLQVLSIKDITPIQHGGCRHKKPRRV